MLTVNSHKSTNKTAIHFINRPNNNASVTYRHTLYIHTGCASLCVYVCMYRGWSTHASSVTQYAPDRCYGLVLCNQTFPPARRPSSLSQGASSLASNICVICNKLYSLLQLTARTMPIPLPTNTRSRLFFTKLCKLFFV